MGLVDGKVALVTGAARGQGRSHAVRLAAEGADVVAVDICADSLETLSYSLSTEDDLDATVREVEASGRRAVKAIADVRSLPELQRAVEAGLAELGRIDIVCANAGIGTWALSWEMSEQLWKDMIDINLTGVFLSNRAVAAGMVKRGWGRIVNIASVAGKEGNPNASAYSASKAGVIGLTKSLGKELATTGVLVNCVAPAVVKTELFSQMTEQHIQFMLSKIPMNRFGEVDEVAEMVAWLASDLCTFATGATFDLSGGRATY